MRILATAIAFGLAAFVAVALTRQSGYIAAVWPANGILLAAIMMAKRHELAAFLLAAFTANVVANLVNSQLLSVSVFLSACSSIEIISAISLMQLYQLGDWMRLEQPKVLGGFLISVCVISPLISATLAAFGLHVLVKVPAQDIFGTWWTANALGLALVTPAVLILFRDGIKASAAAISNKGALLSLLLLTTVTAGVFFQSRYPFIFMVFPPLVVVAFYADFLGVALGLLVVTMVSITMTVLGTGPLSLIPNVTSVEKILVVQVFLATLLIMGFPIAASLSERHKLEHKLEILATTDALTGLSTRRRFEEHFHTVWAEALRERNPVTVMMLDADFFKAYNDGYGHLKGDECIKAVAGIIQHVARRPLDLAVRYGGEEFLLLLSHTSLPGAKLLAAEIHQALGAAHIEHRDSPYGQVTLSIGLASVVPETTMTAANMIEAADGALYKAKRAGRSRTEVAELAPK